MNKARREKIANVVKMLEEAHSITEEIAGEERDAFDNLSEGLQQSDKGQTMDQTATELEEAAQNISDALDALNNAADT